MEKRLLTEPDVCPRCGQALYCSKSARCWCFEVETTPEVLEYVQQRWENCLCPACLAEISKARGNATGINLG